VADTGFAFRPLRKGEEVSRRRGSLPRPSQCRPVILLCASGL